MPEIVHLYGLELTLNLNEFNHYFKYFIHDEGYIENLNKYNEELHKNYKIKYVSEQDEFSTGFCQSFDLGTETHIHLMYKKQASEENNWFVRAHEETHALEEIFGLKKLYTHIKQETGAIVPIHKLPKFMSEIIANIGGCFAVDKRGYNLQIVHKQAQQDISNRIGKNMYLTGKNISKLFK